MCRKGPQGLVVLAHAASSVIRSLRENEQGEDPIRILAEETRLQHAMARRVKLCFELIERVR